MVDVGSKPKPLEGDLETGDVARTHVNYRVGASADRTGIDDLGDRREDAAQFLRRHGSAAKEFDIGLGGQAVHIRVHLHGESADDLVGDELVHAPLNGGRRESDHFADVSVSGAGILAKQVDNSVIEVVHVDTLRRIVARSGVTTQDRCAIRTEVLDTVVSDWKRRPSPGLEGVTVSAIHSEDPMTNTSVQSEPMTRERRPSERSVLMCRPDFFTVSYQINPWMHPENPTDTSRSVIQWNELYRTYRDLGFDVQLVDPIEGLPDMVYAANGGFVLDNIAYGAKFTYPERQPEGPAYMDWFRENGFDVREPECTNEGEGDFLLVGDVILAGTGFRTNLDSHREVADIFGRDVISLELVNPSFYHLDTAIAVLDPAPAEGEQANIAYLPSAFNDAGLAVLRERYPDAILVSEEDASVLGLNSYSDGYNVVIASRAKGFERQLRDRGYNPIGVDLSELLLGGGGVKCCTLELRR